MNEQKLAFLIAPFSIRRFNIIRLIASTRSSKEAEEICHPLLGMGCCLLKLNE